LLPGFLGGLVSSTATAASVARRVSEQSASAGWGAVVILIASAVVFLRQILEVAVVAPGWTGWVSPPLLVLTVVLLAPAVFQWRGAKRESPIELPENPTELRFAIFFALGYGLVLLAAAAAKESLGGRALYAVAVISGLTDVDAITLSTARLVETGRIEQDLGWRVVVTASIANLIAKGVLVALAGAPGLIGRIGPWFALAAAAGSALVALWPPA
jgi:uncharacterized membrane protein (DUF4010 family)